MYKPAASPLLSLESSAIMLAAMDDRFSDFRTTAHAAALRGCTLFADMDANELAKVASVAQQVAFRKGEYVFREGQTARGFFIVRKGAVSVHRVGTDGTERVLNVFRQNQSFAEGALANPGTYPADARAVEDTELLFIPKVRFLELIRSNAELALEMLASMSQHLRILVSAIEDLKGKDVESRLSHWLLRRCPKPPPTEPVTIALDVSKTVLASELSTRNETLSRALARLRDAELIEVDGKRIVIRNPQKLLNRLRDATGEPV